MQAVYSSYIGWVPFPIAAMIVAVSCHYLPSPEWAWRRIAMLLPVPLACRQQFCNLFSNSSAVLISTWDLNPVKVSTEDLFDRDITTEVSLEADCD
ncbi:unnamed protein product [Haemonchus placei]|uniref:MFS domain-containing protein n=1 Tax=Haemonchus placei TaxID=6290 RepID=A0A0N4WBS9_HAEPC|nr:unnamed protein product [Haemonchus placei]